MRELALYDGDVIDNIIGVADDDVAGFPDADDVTDADPKPAIGWTRSAPGQWTPPPAPAPAPMPEDRRITPLAFLNRFTQPERVALEMSSLDNPSATAAQRQQAAALRVMQDDVKAATWIDLARGDTRGGVQQLETIGLLSAGRAGEILDAAIQPHERPAGL